MDYKEFKKKDLKDLEELKKGRKELMPRLRGILRNPSISKEDYKKYSEVLKEYEDEMPALNKVIDFYDFDESSPLSADENQLIEALKTSALGREGLIFKDMLRGEGYKAMKTLMLRGIVVDIKAFRTFSHLPNHDHIGLASEEYPETQEDWLDYRDSGMSLHVSFTKFKQLRKDGKIKWLAEDLRKFCNEDIQQEFEKRFETKKKKEPFWVNYFGKLDGIQNAQELIREGKSAEEIFRIMVVEHMDLDNMDYDEVKAIDKSWWNDIIDERREFLEKSLAELKGE